MEILNIWSLVIILVLFLLIIYFIWEWDSLTYGMTELFTDELVGLPTSNTNLKRIRQILKEENIDTHRMTLIDFGCGKGDILIGLSNDFKRLIGIELNTKLARIAKKRCRNVANIRIHANDILDYKFRERPTILYVYEPLWQLPRDTADKIYHKVIKRLEKIKNFPIYIVYLTGLKRSDLVPILKNSNFELIRREALGIYPYRDLYIYFLDKSK